MFDIKPAATRLFVGLIVLAVAAGGCRTTPANGGPTRAEPAQGTKKRQEQPGLLTSTFQPRLLTQAELERT